MNFTMKENCSKQWSNLLDEEFSKVDDDFLESFRSPGHANKFVAWDPYEKSTRYFKFLLYQTAHSVEHKKILECYQKLSNSTELAFGAPIHIEFEGLKINADYWAAAEECEFLRGNNLYNGGGQYC